VQAADALGEERRYRKGINFAEGSFVIDPKRRNRIGNDDPVDRRVHDGSFGAWHE
jgi:hypothetical protein